MDGTLEEVQDLLDTDGVEEVDLNGRTIEGRQGKVLMMRRPGITLRNGTIKVKGGNTKIWFRSGNSGDEWIGVAMMAHHCHLDRVTVTGVREPGVAVGVLDAHDVTLVDCVVTDTAETGLWINGERASVQVQRTVISQHGGRGVLVGDGARVRLTQCGVRGNEGMGVNVVGEGSKVDIFGGEVVESGSHGVWADDGGHATLVGVTCRSGARDGLRATGPHSEVQCTDGAVLDHAKAGVCAADEGKVVCKRTTVLGNETVNIVEEYGGKVLDADGGLLAAMQEDMERLTLAAQGGGGDGGDG